MANDRGSMSVEADLQVRRARLEDAMRSLPDDPHLARLLGEVDAALERLEKGAYGLCEACHEPIETERILSDPLVRYCLDHLTSSQQEALENDLTLASRIQERLLPERSLQAGRWAAAYYYDPAGPVSGDYCDLLDVDGGFFFVVGDVSGKGVSAAMLMAHLQAMLRALISQRLPLDQIMERASRMLCESTLPTHYATMACGRADDAGEVQLSIAGHESVLLSRGSEIQRIEATGLPLGMFCDERFAVTTAHLAPGDSLLLHTDGVSEALDMSGRVYGAARLAELLKRHHRAAPEEILSACIDDLGSFRAGATRADDATIMVLQRLASGSS